MKKKGIVILAMLTIGMVGFSQAVKDRQVIPVAVNLNQVLRMTITNGGNIEFVFNSIDDYRLGLSGTGAAANPLASGDFYVTDFTVASSARWELNFGSEEATFIGTDDPTAVLALNNVGYTLESVGAHGFEAAGAIQGTDITAELWSAPTVNGTEVAGLTAYPDLLIDDNGGLLGDANAGDGADNSFQMVWRCGTAEVSAGIPNMVATSILNQDPSPAPDRYVTNVLFELGIK